MVLFWMSYNNPDMSIRFSSSKAEETQTKYCDIIYGN